MKKVEEETGGVPYAYVLGALDVKDAFLQVPQEEPAQVSAPNGIFEVKRNLPGQRIGAKAWFEHLTKWLSEKGFIFSQTNPCLGRLEDKMMVLIHVDDVMFTGEKAFLVCAVPHGHRKHFPVSPKDL